MRIKYKAGQDYLGVHGTPIILSHKHPESKHWFASVKDNEGLFLVNTVQLSRGNFKTPFCRTVYGVGYSGIGPFVCRDSNNKVTKEYSVWANIVKRCCTNYEKNRSGHCYADVNICEDWLNYQTFAAWYTQAITKFIENGIEPKIDKDLLGGKEYSPENCVILPNVINCMMSEMRITSKICCGVQKVKGKYQVNLVVNNKPNRLGRFSTVEEAVNAYAIAKKQALINFAEEYKHVLEDRAYNALLNWEHTRITK